MILFALIQYNYFHLQFERTTVLVLLNLQFIVNITMNKSQEWNRLPRQKADRQKLKKAILKYAKKLYDQNQNDNQQKIQKLKLRLSLIDACNDMSLVRLGHLEYIFKYYCTHIFKVGKHMTFDNLQYQKNHMNMDRFFLFLRDFALITGQINGRKVEIVDKNQIILIFKKISPNSKVITFQGFITLLERVGVMYYDAKQGGYQARIAKQKQERKRKREQYQKRKKAKLAKSKKLSQQGKQFQQGQQNQKQNQQAGEQENQEKQQKQQNDNLVQQMMNDEKLEDPNDEVQNNIKKHNNQRTAGEQVQWEKQKQLEEQSEQNPFLNLQNDDILLILTKDQKIEYFYKKINVDSASDYKQRLSELNQPVYNTYSKSARDKKRAQQRHSQNKIDKSQEIDLQKSVGSVDLQAEQRKRALQEKMNQKKSKQKAMPIPKPKPDEAANMKNQERKRRMQQNKQRLNQAKKSKQQTDELLQKKMDQKRVPFGSDKKRVDFDQKQISWNVMNLSIEQLKLKQFNPAKLFANEEDDRIFLDQYLDRSRGGGKALDIRQRNSTSVVQGLKKRLDQVEKTERNKQKKLKQKIGLGQLVRQKF